MALKKVSERELLRIVLEKDGLKKILANQNNLERISGIDDTVISRLRTLLEREGKSGDEIKIILEELKIYTDTPGEKRQYTQWQRKV